MMKMSKFYGFLRGHANLQLTDKTGKKVYYNGTVNAIPDAFANRAVIDFEETETPDGETAYHFIVKA